jgi:hypothetical protein
MNQNLFKITTKICRMMFKGFDTDKIIKSYFIVMTSMIRSNGTVYTVKALKTMRLHITRYICGEPLMVNNCGVGVDRSGWPKRLLFLKPLLDKGILGKKLLLTIIGLSRTLELRNGEEITPDYTTIERPGPSVRYTIPYGVIRRFIRTYNLKRGKPEFSISDVFLSVKGSPTGKASLTSVVSVLLLSYPQMH